MRIVGNLGNLCGNLGNFKKLLENLTVIVEIYGNLMEILAINNMVYAIFVCDLPFSFFRARNLVSTRIFFICMFIFLPNEHVAHNYNNNILFVRS